MNAVIKYPGSKWSIANWIISFFPKHHSYLEPFFGSGAVLFNKPRSNIETVNDMDGSVVNLFRWIKNDPEKLAHEIYYTPYSRQVYDDSFKSVPDDSLQRAVNLCVRLNMGHGFRTNGKKVGWKNDIQGRERAYAALDWTTMQDRIMTAAERLRGVQIECKPAIDVIKRFNFDNVLIYADPPYVLSTRHGKQYKHEMDDDDHEQLLQSLLAHKGPVIISGYDSDVYNDLLKGWYRKHQTAYSQVCSKKDEVIWMNFRPDDQMRLDEMAEAEEEKEWNMN